MKIEKFFPTQVLLPYVKQYLIIESEQTISNRILPGTAVSMAFRFKGKTTSDLLDATVPAFCVTGILKGPRTITYDGRSGVVVTHFHDGGAGPFFNVPLHELSSAHTSLADLFPAKSISKLEDDFSASKGNVQRVATIERFLMDHLKTRRIDRLPIQAIDLITALRGNLRINEVANRLNINLNSLEKQFRAQVGVSPKHFSSLLRFKLLINSYQPGKQLTDLAYESGYFDQSHFNRHFKNYAGENPLQFLKRDNSWQM